MIFTNMPSRLTIIKEKKDWQLLLDEVTHYDSYQTYDYHQISKSDDEIPILIKYKDDDILIGLPLLLRKIKNTEYFDATSVYGYAGPIQKNVPEKFDNKLFRDELNSFFVDNNIVSVFSRLNPFIENQEIILGYLGELRQLSKIVNINLKKDLDDQRMIFSKTTKRYINKGRKVCSVRKGKSKEDIAIFKELYYENMDRVNAKKDYYFDDKYLNALVDSKDFEIDIFYAILNENNETIGAAIMIKTNDIIQYHISGTKNDYLYLTPIRLLIDEMRIEGTQQNYTYFNLGGGLGSTEDSLFRFKSSFSKDFKDFKVWKYIVNQKVYDELSDKYAPNIGTDFFPKYRSPK